MSSGSEQGKKTFVLVFPPMTMPTSPPLGPALLKAFIERELPDWHVKVLDLNLWFLEWLIELIKSNKVKLGPPLFPSWSKDRESIINGAAGFRTRGMDNYAKNPMLYDEHADLFIRLTMAFSEFLEKDCKNFDSGGQSSQIPQRLIQRILDEKPDSVGFSMIFSNQLAIGATLGKCLRLKHGLKVYLGGSCFSEGAEHFIKWYPDAADVIVDGDGEFALRDLLSNNGKPDNIPGAVWISNGIINTNQPVYHQCIDDFEGPDFDDVDFTRYFSPEPVAPILLSRGCYWRRCTFCVHYMSAGLTYRLHSVDRVVAMIRKLVDRGVRRFALVDEMIAPGHFFRFARAIISEELDIAYYALAKPTPSFTADILETIAASGCKYILWGVESGSQRVVDLMDKGTKVTEMSLVLRRAHDAGIANHVYIICGFPTETAEEFSETIRFLSDNRDIIYAVHRGLFGLEKNAPVFRRPEAFGINKVWLIRDTPLGGSWGYMTSVGMTREQAQLAFQNAVHFLRAFSPHARFLANYRDHALLIYASHPGSLSPQTRQFPNSPSPHPPSQPTDGRISVTRHC